MTPTLVLVHGFPLDHAMWDGVRAALDPRIPVLAPDLPGCDGGRAPAGAPSLDRWADALAALPGERLVVAGMSMGGYAALAFAERHPGRLAGLALVATHPYADTDEQKAGRAALIAKIREGGAAVAAEAMMGKLFRDAEGGRTGEGVAVRAAAERVGVEGLCYALAAMAARPDRTRVWSSLSAPAMVIHGDADAIVPAARARAYAALNPRATYVELPGVGHHSPAESPAAVANALASLWNQAASGEL